MTLFACIACLPLHAEEFWSETTTIDQLYPTVDGVAFIVAYSNPVSTCENGRRYFIPKGAENYQATIAALYLAFATGSGVQLHLFDQAPSCAPVVDRFVVFKS